MNVLAIDCETNGLDLRHGARPFFVTICYPNGQQIHWRWPVDPLTRKVTVDPDDVEQIRDLLESADEIIGQNIKFDILALSTVGIEWPREWWDKTNDTLIAGHLLYSGLPHNITDMFLQYCGGRIEQHEKRLQDAVQAARRYCRSHHPDWKIMKEGTDGFPSDGGSLWRGDYWLPRTLWEKDDEIRLLDHPEWGNVLEEYSNADSAATLAVWQAQRNELTQRELWAYYRECMRLARVIHVMEGHGVSINRSRLETLRTDYVKESEDAYNVCVGIASNFGYRLELSSGINDSLRRFMFDVLKLPHRYNPKAKTSEPTLNKEAMEWYVNNLPENSPELAFVKNLLKRRKREGLIGYMDSYRKFWVKDDTDETNEWYTLYSSFNQTGTSTTRLTSERPNSQQYSKQNVACPMCYGSGEKGADVCPQCDGKKVDPRSIRFLLGPKPGREWWSLDKKNIELRIPAFESGEPDLIALFERPNDPPFYGSQHLLNFSIVYDDIWETELRHLESLARDAGSGVPFDEAYAKVGPHCKKKFAYTWYQWCKNGGLGMQYQAGRNTADRAFHRDGAFDRLKSRFTSLEAHNQRCIRYADRYGYVETIPDRSIDPTKGYPLMCSRGERGGISITVPLAYRTQGSAGWDVRRGMVRCQEQLEQWESDPNDGFDGKLIINVHDELVFDFPKSKLDPRKDKSEGGTLSNLWRVWRLKYLMELTGRDYGMDLPVGVEYHPDDWGTGVTFA